MIELVGEGKFGLDPKSIDNIYDVCAICMLMKSEICGLTWQMLSDFRGEDPAMFCWNQVYKKM